LVPIPADVVRRYLDGEPAVCPRCGATDDWWSVLLSMVRSVMTVPLSVIGAQRLSVQLTLRRGRETVIDFTGLGVPEDARILRAYFTADAEGQQSWLSPTHALGSQPGPPWIPRKFAIYPWPFDIDGARATTKVNMLVAWLPAGDPDVARAQLTDAFDAYTGAEDSAKFVIPANTAVEVAVASVIDNWLRDNASAQHVDRFLTDAATYSHQLNVLMPALAGALGAPQLPDHIRGALNRLRRLRNQIAHSGKFDAPITHFDAAECLCAAFFGVEYARLIEQVRQRQPAT
jgi:hypothetical protein